MDKEQKQHDNLIAWAAIGFLVTLVIGLSVNVSAQSSQQSGTACVNGTQYCENNSLDTVNTTTTTNTNTNTNTNQNTNTNTNTNSNTNVSTNTNNSTNTNSNTKINIQELNSGIYFLQALFENNQITHKRIIVSN